MNEKGDLVPTKPVREAARDILALPDPSLPSLDGVVTTPVFGSDGTLIIKPGYHPDYALWLHLPDGFKIDSVPERPTKAEIDKARRKLASELLGDFPFVSDSDLAHAIAAILLPFIRLMIDGCAPLQVLPRPIGQISAE